MAEGSKVRCDLMLSRRAKGELAERAARLGMSMSAYVESVLVGGMRNPEQYDYAQLRLMDNRLSCVEDWLTASLGFVDWRTLNPSVYEQMIG